MAQTDKHTEIIEILKRRFAEWNNLGDDAEWQDIECLLTDNAIKAASFMEKTGGEPHIYELPGRQLVIGDLSEESPKGRRSLCYDEEGRTGRKGNAPQSSAVEMAHEHGIELIDESEYMYLQSIRTLDLKTSSWLLTPEDIRNKGGALFAEHRYGRTFVFANSAGSYYSSRGFRAKIILE